MSARRLLAMTSVALIALTVVVTPVPAGATSSAGKVPKDVRDFPYCEVIPDTVSGGTTTEHVFNTLGFNACPSGKWKTITEDDVVDAYNAAYGGKAMSATLNGRRHWVMDTIKSDGGTTSSPDTLTVNGIEFGLKGLLQVPAGSATIGTDAYVVNTVQRNTTYVFKAGRKLFELVDPKGRVYVMQSYSTQFCPKQTLKDLPKIGPKLQLPKGWLYRSRTAEQDLTLTAAGATQIVNDYCRNTYQINPDAHM